MRRLLPVTVALIVAACASVPAHDPDIVQMGGPAGGGRAASGAGVTPMTYAELQQCAMHIRDMDQQDAGIDAASARLDGRRAALDRLGDSLDVARPSVNTRDSVSVKRFNQALDRHRSGVRTFNVEVDRHNASIEAYKQLQNTFNTACANRSYRRSHYAQLPVELRAAVERRSKESDVPVRRD